MSTLDDVIADAKATGEFEGSMEEIRALYVTLKGFPEVIAHDTSCGAMTTFTRLVVDRGISFDKIVHTIVDDDESLRMSNAKSFGRGTMSSDEKQCKSGFYISRRLIAGCHLIIFAQRKVIKDIGKDTDFLDPLKLMIIYQPNTGKNPCEMASKELRNKYKLLLSSKDVIGSINAVGDGENESTAHDGEETSDNDVSTCQHSTDANMIRTKWGSVADLWDDTYANSNFNYHNDGLAP